MTIDPERRTEITSRIKREIVSSSHLLHDILSVLPPSPFFPAIPLGLLAEKERKGENVIWIILLSYYYQGENKKNFWQTQGLWKYSKQ